MKLVRKSYLIFFLSAIIIFLSVEVSPDTYWIAGLLSFCILPYLLVNTIFVFYFLMRKHFKWFFISVLLYGIGYKHLQRTFSINITQEKGNIKVLNSNVRIFNVYKHLRDEKRTTSKEMIKWIANSDADIMILQEYYNMDTSSIWNTRARISKKFPHNYLKVSLYNRIKAEFGQIIYSRHPIINSGIIPYENKTFNQAIYSDIKINNDTVRVYNIHLQSMAIEERKLFNEKNNKKNIKRKVKDTSSKLIKGFKHRTKQINKIIKHIKESPYPVILGCDMNDTPYSYSYNEFSKILNNSFEERGNGFGFSFNGKLFFLRIDNIFTSKELETNSFKVHKEIPYSDHFPISATYTLKH